MSTVNDDAINCEVSNDVFEMRCYSDVKISPPNANKINSKNNRNKSSGKCLIIIIVFVISLMLILAATIASVVFVLLEISKLKTEDDSLSIGLQQHRVQSPLDNITASFDRYTRELAEIRQSLYNVGALELRAELSRNIEELAKLRHNFSQFHYYVQQLRADLEVLAHCPINILSCSSLPSFCPSGYYFAKVGFFYFDRSTVRVYCDMTLSCGGVTGGWTRVAELNMIDTSQQCPSGLVEGNETGIRHCRVDGDSCTSVHYHISVPYSSVCGRITAYQVGSTNAFQRYYQNTNTPTIGSNYVDGVSLTHGNPRQHIWTFAAALDKQHDNLNSKCPCLFDRELPPFVGEDYFCDAGIIDFMTGETGLQTDPLWDGTDCLCCDNPPWFYKQLPQTTTDDIEMRVCKDGSDENIAITEIKIFVRFL